MVRKKATTRKKPMASKASKKVQIQSRPNPFRSKRLLVAFVVALAAVGTIQLIRSYALPGYSFPLPPNVDTKDVLVEYSRMGANRLELKNNRLYHYNMPLLIRLMRNGELTCNNGTDDTVNTAVLSSNEVNRIKRKVDELGLKSLPGLVTPGDDKLVVINSESITLYSESGEVEKSVEVPSQFEKPAQFRAVEQFLRQECQRASSRKDLKDVPTTRRLRSIPQQASGVSGTVSNLLFPKVAAKWGPGHNASTTKGEDIHMWNVNSHRNNIRKPLYGFPGCMRISARRWSVAMGKGSTASNSNMHHGPFMELMTQECKSSPTFGGENVGFVEWYHGAGSIEDASLIIWNALMNSSGHRANIEGDFTRFGVGIAYYDLTPEIKNGYWRLYVTQHFARCDWGNCALYK